MDLGEKIRSARLSAGMTQSELAGDFITRNMLSQIENGSATPSLQTVRYIAAKLGTDIGTLLSEGDNAEVYNRIKLVQQLKKKYSSGAYEECISMCTQKFNDCDEVTLILADCYCRMAYENYRKGRLKSAADDMENARKYAALTVYPSEYIRQRVDVLEDAVSLVLPKLKTKKRTKDALTAYTEFFISKNAAKSPYISFIEAKRLTGEGEYKMAEELMTSMLKKADELDYPLLYLIYRELEVCNRETDDYENAYKHLKLSRRMAEEMNE